MCVCVWGTTASNQYSYGMRVVAAAQGTALHYSTKYKYAKMKKVTFQNSLSKNRARMPVPHALCAPECVAAYPVLVVSFCR